MEELLVIDEPSVITSEFMTRKHIVEILEIEKQSFRRPWSDLDFLGYIEDRKSGGIVARVRDIPVGYVVYELQKDVIGILNFAVGQDWRRQGIGRHLFGRVLDRMESPRRHRIFMGISEYYLDGQHFLKAMGCLCIQNLASAIQNEPDALIFEFIKP